MNHSDLVRSLAGVAPPNRLRALMLYLAGGSFEIVDPRQRSGVHPLVIPLARDDQGHTIGLLRWATPPADLPMPLVRQRGPQLDYLAGSADEMLRRELATRDVRGESLDALLAVANEAGPLYEVGEVARTGLPLKAFLLLKVGVGFGFLEELAEAHLDRGDPQAALVTADRACRITTGWARPHAFRALLLNRLGIADEARDAARVALLEPVWTLGIPYERVAELAGLDATSAPYRALAQRADRPVLDRAAHLLDAVAIEDGDWDRVRPELARLYEQAGLTALAGFVR